MRLSYLFSAFAPSSDEVGAARRDDQHEPQEPAVESSSPSALAPRFAWGPRTPVLRPAGRRHMRSMRIAVTLLLSPSLVGSIYAASSTKARSSEVELRNSVEDLLETSVRAIDLRLPADGLLELDLLVHRGPGVTVHVISRASGGPGTQFRIYPDFSATDSTTTRKIAWLPRGDYYLTLINPSAAGPIKVRIFARFRPAIRSAAAHRE